ncbi:hypothetical protein [Staphylococcus edaphicus]|uniref:DUF1146 domain-containing protein n=1 Tax=Staphylococcus edaphicus TaxID=1955013 RepID=A0A2C6VJJ6_9STAP|nr:hypothetical protein [Staphylococcus edaphicus]PHK50381.1 hypothetical protein BTJ66_02730 [Staphylococcus edaphicus]UQW81065.1 hypothetical protein MNY58_10845 [Staphylococcus edaphicus]
MMVLGWTLLMIIISVFTKWIVHLLIQRQSVYFARVVITGSCIIQFIIAYFLIKAIVHYLAQALDVFYR